MSTKYPIACPVPGLPRRGDDRAGKFQAKREGGSYESAVILVLTAAIQEVYVVQAGVADGDNDLGLFRYRSGDG